MATQLSIRHKFAGGWATDIGPLIDLAPEGGQMLIPHLLLADNCFFELDGAPHKEFGTTELFSSALESGASIKGIFDYWRQGTAGSPAQHRLIAIADHIYKDDANGTFTSIFSGLTSGAVPHFSQFDDIAIFANDATGDVPRSWDTSTAQNLAGSPPNFSFSAVHSGHLFAAGVAANPSRLYFSVPFDPEDWTGTGSGNIDIDPDDGDVITGIISYKQRLVVFKGPNKGSIHIITGTSSDDFAHVNLQAGVGAVWQNSIVRAGDDVTFLWSDGHLYSLAATERFGDFREGAQITRVISSWIDEHYNASRLKHASLVNWPSRGILLAAVPIDSATEPNFILMVDYRFDPPRLAPWPAFDHLTSLALVVDSASSNRRIIMAGGDDGKVYKLGQPTRSLKNGTQAIDYDVQTPFLNYGDSFILKTPQSLAIGFAPKNDGEVTFEFVRDDNSAQSVEVSQGGGDVLGDADANEFTLGTSVLGGARFVDRFVDIENGGQFRSIQYRIKNSVNNEEVEVHSFSAILEIDGPSLEN